METCVAPHRWPTDATMEGSYIPLTTTILDHVSASLGLPTLVMTSWFSAAALELFLTATEMPFSIMCDRTHDSPRWLRRAVSSTRGQLLARRRGQIFFTRWEPVKPQIVTQ